MRPTQTRLYLLAFATCLATIAGCEDAARECSQNGDCFAGEVCVAGSCEAGSAGNAGADTGGLADTGGGTDTGGRGEDTGGGSGSACVIDPFGNTCTSDALEPNDLAGPNGSTMLVDSQSWCGDDGTIDTAPRSFPATFCAGEEADSYRFSVYNSGPNHTCIDGPVRLVYTVTLDRACEPDRIAIWPNYSGADYIDGCARESMDGIRCEVSDDGRTYTFTFLWTTVMQMYDAYLYVHTPNHDDVQFGYDVTVQVIPQNQ